MAGPTVTSTLEILHDSICRAHITQVWGGSDDDEATLIDLSSIALKGAVPDADGNTSGGLRPLGIKIYSIKGQLVGDIRQTFEFKGVIADQALPGGIVENNANDAMPVDIDYRKSRNGCFKPYVSEGFLPDTAWDAQANVTSTQDSTIKKVGADSAKLALAAGFTTGLIASDEFGPADIRGYDGVGFWIRSSIALQRGDLSFLLDETANCASPDKTLPIDFALVADQWIWIEQSLGDVSALNAVVSAGLRSDRDFGAASLYVDGLRFKKMNPAINAASAIGDLVCTSVGGAIGDFANYEIEFGLIWGPDSYKGV